MATKGKKGTQRKLTAILCADVVGYSRLMGDDEAATVETITAYRKIFSKYVKEYRGRVVNAPGDSILAEFASVVDAVEGAAEIQRELAERNAELVEERKMVFRIGINVGDVVVKEEAIYGDGVNVAARLESLAEPGGICISRSAYDQVKNKLKLEYEYLGEQQVKNIEEPVRAYRLFTETVASAHQEIKPKEITRIKWHKKMALTSIVLVLGSLIVLVVWNFWGSGNISKPPEARFSVSGPCQPEFMERNGGCHHKFNIGFIDCMMTYSEATEQEKRELNRIQALISSLVVQYSEGHTENKNRTFRTAFERHIQACRLSFPPAVPDTNIRAKIVMLDSVLKKKYYQGEKSDALRINSHVIHDFLVERGVIKRPEGYVIPTAGNWSAYEDLLERRPQLVVMHLSLFESATADIGSCDRFNANKLGEFLQKILEDHRTRDTAIVIYSRSHRFMSAKRLLFDCIGIPYDSSYKNRITLFNMSSPPRHFNDLKARDCFATVVSNILSTKLMDKRLSESLSEYCAVYMEPV